MLLSLSKSFGGLVEEVMTAANDDMEIMIAPFYLVVFHTARSNKISSALFMFL